MARQVIGRWPAPVGGDPDFNRLSRIIDSLRDQVNKNQSFVLDYSIATTGNIAATATILYQSLIPAGLLSRNGDSIGLRAAFTYAATASANKVITFYLGPIGVYTSSPSPGVPATQLYTTGNIAANNHSIVFDFDMVRYAAAITRYDLAINSSFSSLAGLSSYGNNTNDTQADMYLTVIASGTLAGDVTGFKWKVNYIPTSDQI